MRYYLVVLVGFVLLLIPARASDEIELILGRLADIEARLEKNEELLKEGHLPATEAESNKPNLDLTNIIEKLNDLTRRIQALEEKSGHTPEKQGENKGKLEGLDLGAAMPLSNTQSEDVDAILMDLEKKGELDAQSPEEKKAIAQAEKSAPLLPMDDFQSQYDQGLGLLKKGEHRAAVESFEYCLKTFPNQKKDDRVLYQLGQSYFGCKNYNQAKKSYAKAYRKDPKGPLAPYALFGLAQVFVQEKNTKNACATLKEIAKKHPKLDTQLQKDIMAAKKEHCKE